MANILETRKETVTLVTPHSELKLELTPDNVSAGVEIEEKLICELIIRHREFVREQQRMNVEV